MYWQKKHIPEKWYASFHDRGTFFYRARTPKLLAKDLFFAVNECSHVDLLDFICRSCSDKKLIIQLMLLYISLIRFRNFWHLFCLMFAPKAEGKLVFNPVIEFEKTRE